MKRTIFVSVLLILVTAVAGSPQSITTGGSIETDAQLVSKVATGTAPLSVSSTTVVPNLNADQVDGVEGTALALDADLQNAEAMLVALQGQVNALGLALVPRTGQTTCYDGGGAVTACGTGVGLGQDGDLQLGVSWPNPRFTVNESSPGVADGTVTDNLTGLIWLHKQGCFGSVAWADAPAKANGLYDGSTNDLLGGDCDLDDGSVLGEWRLPNVRELQSLLHYGFKDPALPNTSGTGKAAAGDPFTTVSLGNVWSSTTSMPATDQAWVVHFGDGFTGDFSKIGGASVWPVRGGQ